MKWEEFNSVDKKDSKHQKDKFQEINEMQTCHSKVFGKAKKMQQFMPKMLKENRNLEIEEYQKDCVFLCSLAQGLSSTN